MREGRDNTQNSDITPLIFAVIRKQLKIINSSNKATNTNGGEERTGGVGGVRRVNSLITLIQIAILSIITVIVSTQHDDQAVWCFSA